MGDLSPEAAEQRKRDRDLQELKNWISNLTFGFFDDATGKIVTHITVAELRKPNIAVLQHEFNPQFVPWSVIRKQKQLASILEDRRREMPKKENLSRVSGKI